jgi:hypothetical protein
MTSARLMAVRLCFAAFCCPHLVSSQTTAAQQQVREAIAAQLRVDFLSHGIYDGQISEAAAKALQLVPAFVFLGDTIWRTEFHGITHWRPFLLALTADTLIRLGAFADADLIRYASKWRARFLNTDSARSRSLTLAKLVDPNGATEVIDAERSGQDRAIAWRTSRPPDWPSDTGFVRHDYSLVVRLTVLSLDAWSGNGQRWDHFVYAFEFARDGKLIAWSRSDGESRLHPR